jgi:hypothetical protein
MHLPDAPRDEPPHADGPRKDDNSLHNEQLLCKARDDRAGTPGRHRSAPSHCAGRSDGSYSQLQSGAIPYSRSRRAHRPGTTLARAQDDEGVASLPPEPSAEQLPQAREPQSPADARLLSTGQARLDRVYERLVALGLRRRARLHQIAAEAEE